jgi:hypothetical protein
LAFPDFLLIFFRIRKNADCSLRKVTTNAIDASALMRYNACMDIHPGSQELLIGRLRELYTQEMSWKKVAERLGVSTAYLGDVVHGKRQAGPKILEPLHLKLIGYYIKTD